MKMPQATSERSSVVLPLMLEIHRPLHNDHQPWCYHTWFHLGNLTSRHCFRILRVHCRWAEVQGVEVVDLFVRLRALVTYLPYAGKYFLRLVGQEKRFRFHRAALRFLQEHLADFLELLETCRMNLEHTRMHEHA